MRIAVYHNLHSGGAKRTTSAIVARLSQRHEIDLYSLSCADHRFADLGSHVRSAFVYPFQPSREISSPFGRLNNALRLADLTRLERLQKDIAGDIDRRGYDVVYVHPCQFTQTPVVVKYLRTPTLYHCRESLRMAYEAPVQRPYQVTNRLASRINRLDVLAAAYRKRRQQLDVSAMRQATLVVTNSYFTREQLIGIYGVDARVCYHGVDTQMFQPLGSARNGGVLSVGALTPLKGFDFLIKSLSLIPSPRRPELTLISNYHWPAECTYLEEMATRLLVTVHMLRLVDNDVLLASYNQAALVAYAPVLEPFGLVPLEAMACGTPIVAVREGGVRESVVDRETGLLVDRDPAQFAEAVRQLLDNPTLAADYGRRGREHVLRYWTWEHAVETLERHLTTCACTRQADSESR